MTSLFLFQKFLIEITMRSVVTFILKNGFKNIPNIFNIKIFYLNHTESMARRFENFKSIFESKSDFYSHKSYFRK